MTKEIVDYVYCSTCRKQVSNKVGLEVIVHAWVQCSECLAEDAWQPREIAARVAQRQMPTHELMKKLEALPWRDLAGLVFYLVGYMSVQSPQVWDTYCEGIKASPYFSEETQEKEAGP